MHSLPASQTRSSSVLRALCGSQLHSLLPAFQIANFSPIDVPGGVALPTPTGLPMFNSKLKCHLFQLPQAPLPVLVHVLNLSSHRLQGKANSLTLGLLCPALMYIQSPEISFLSSLLFSAW